jgi:hypothetical protein
MKTTLTSRLISPSVRMTLALGSALLLSASAHATVLASADFSTYTDGNLAGQNGWVQYNTQSTAPIQVDGGEVRWNGNGNTVVNNQDVMLSFGQIIAQPASGTTVLHFDLLLSILTAGTGAPAYFAALNSFDTTVTTNNFQNVRMVAQASGAGFVFGTRVNGQGGYPFAYGTDVLTFGTTYALRAEVNLVAGNANDFVRLFVGNDFNSLPATPYATATYGSGTVTDITVGAMLLSQFANTTTFESGVVVNSMSVTLVPEPSSLALAGLALVAVGFGRRRSTRA